MFGAAMVPLSQAVLYDIHPVAQCARATSIWTQDISEWSVIRTGFVQGVSLGFITIPINIITFATLPASLRTEGAGIYSLVRDLGSAIGISVTGALPRINTQVKHAVPRCHCCC